MKKIFLLNTLLVVAVIFGSCGKCCKKDGDKAQCSTTADTTACSKSANVKDTTVVGTYFGTLPCADCSGIETTVTFNADDSYSKVSKYLDTETKEFKEEGKYHFCCKRKIATLVSSKNDTTLFAVEGNQIVLLGADGKKTEGDLSEHYILKKK